MSTSQNLKNVATGQATPQEARNPYEQLKRQLETSKAEFKPLLGTDTNVDRFIRVVLNAVLANPDLLEADRRSLIASCMKAAQDGLLPDGREAVLNIYNTKVKKNGQESWVKMAQYLPMVQGMIKNFYAHPDVATVDAAAVYANDKFLFRRGDDPKLEHEPTLDDDAGPVVAAYLVVKLKSGEIKREMMPRRDIEKVRAASKSPDGASSPWVKWYDQQSIKSVIKRGAKQLPRADALEKVVASDNEALGFVDINTPSTVGNALRPAQAPQALENSPSETAHFDMQDARDKVPVEGYAEQRASAQESAGEVDTVSIMRDRIANCKDVDVLDLVTDEIRYLDDAAAQKELNELAKVRREELSA